MNTFSQHQKARRLHRFPVQATGLITEANTADPPGSGVLEKKRRTHGQAAWSEGTAASRGRLPYGDTGLRQLADPTGIYLVVVFFQIVRVLIHIS
jgi:hypothetical protein